MQTISSILTSRPRPLLALPLPVLLAASVVLVKDLCNDLPLAVRLEASVEVGVREPPCILLQIDLDTRGRRSDSEDINLTDHVGCRAVFLNVTFEVTSWATQEWTSD